MIDELNQIAEAARYRPPDRLNNHFQRQVTPGFSENVVNPAFIQNVDFDDLVGSTVDGPCSKSFENQRRSIR